MEKLSLAKNKIKILLLEGVHSNAENFFKEHGYTNVERLAIALDEESLIEKLQNVFILGVRSRTQITAKVLKHPNAKKLMAIGCFCIGTNQTDLQAATAKGIPVFNAPFSNTRSVAELVVAESVMLLRRIVEKNALAHQGIWKKTAIDAHEVRGKKLGIIGYGRIGSQVSVLAESWGMQVYYFDIEKKLSIGNAIPCESLEELLGIADVVTLHVPGTPQTKNLITQKELSIMKKGSSLINCARGTVVDIEALVAALKNEHLGGAAVDVFPTEPAANADPFESELLGLKNVLLTPHIGGSTEEAQENIALEVAEKLVKYSDNGSTTGSANFANVSLPIHEQSNRILHVHYNVPGVLEKINQIFSLKSINIAAQYLQTNSSIGYVILDVQKDSLTKGIITELKKVPSTIRVRILY